MISSSCKENVYETKDSKRAGYSSNKEPHKQKQTSPYEKAMKPEIRLATPELYRLPKLETEL